MQDLYEATKENVQLAVYEDGAALVLERIHGPTSVMTKTNVGGRLPLHASAVGKVLLAFADEAELNRVVARGLPAFTPATVTDPLRLAGSLKRIRERGIAYVFEEMSKGAVSVAVPVFDTSGSIRAALSIVIHASTVPYHLAPAVRTAAQNIKRNLPPQQPRNFTERTTASDETTEAPETGHDHSKASHHKGLS